MQTNAGPDRTPTRGSDRRALDVTFVRVSPPIGANQRARIECSYMERHDGDGLALSGRPASRSGVPLAHDQLHESPCRRNNEPFDRHALPRHPLSVLHPPRSAIGALPAPTAWQHRTQPRPTRSSPRPASAKNPSMASWDRDRRPGARRTAGKRYVTVSALARLCRLHRASGQAEQTPACSKRENCAEMDHDAKPVRVASLLCDGV